MMKDLTGKNFNNSTIKNSNFSDAKTDGAIWENSKRMFNLGTQNDTKKSKKSKK
jgi:hypothetical protein